MKQKYSKVRMIIQWNPSSEVTSFAPEKWPFKRGGLLPGVEINTFMFRFTLPSGLSRGGGLPSGWTQKGFHCISHYLLCSRVHKICFVVMIYLVMYFFCPLNKCVNSNKLLKSLKNPVAFSI